MLTLQLDHKLMGRNFLAMEMYSLAENDLIAVVHVAKQADELRIEHFETQTSTDRLDLKINPGLPISLVINNRHIIQRDVEGAEPNDSKLLHKAFPNINVPDFYYEILRLDSRSLVAICRKQYIDDLLRSYRDAKIIFHSVSIGICAIGQLKPFVHDGALTVSNCDISLDDPNYILADRNKEGNKNYKINGLKVDSNYLLSFASVLQSFSESDRAGNIREVNSILHDDYLQKSFFSKALKALVIFLFTILLLNFLLFDYYFTKVSELSADLDANSSNIEAVKAVKARLQSKEIKLKDLTNPTTSRSSFYINEIVKQIPQSMSLTELTYQPLEKPVKDDEAVLTHPNSVLISGKLLDPPAFTEWMEDLAAYDWIKETTIIFFGKNDSAENVFSIRITIAPNEAK